MLCCTSAGNRLGFSTLTANVVTDLHAVDMSGASQCFPLIVYTSGLESGPSPLFSDAPQHTTESGLSDASIDLVMKTYNKTSDSAFEIKKDDVFYYIYGLLHSDDYRDRFADNLSGNFRASPS